MFFCHAFPRTFKKCLKIYDFHKLQQPSTTNISPNNLNRWFWCQKCFQSQFITHFTISDSKAPRCFARVNQFPSKISNDLIEKFCRKEKLCFLFQQTSISSSIYFAVFAVNLNMNENKPKKIESILHIVFNKLSRYTPGNCCEHNLWKNFGLVWIFFEGFNNIIIIFAVYELFSRSFYEVEGNEICLFIGAYFMRFY